MTNLEETCLSAKSNFSLLGEDKIAQLALNGEVVTVNSLRMKGLSLTKSPENHGNGEPCDRCAKKETGLLRLWYKVSITCNNVRGDIWVCSHCSKVTKTRAGKDVWAELEKSRELDFSNNKSVAMQSASSTPCLPCKEDFESAYKILTRPGDSISIDSVLDQIEVTSKNEGIILKSNWRMITERSIEIWSKKG